MYSRPAAALKIVGTISLGLLTGTTLALNHIAIPALLALPSAVACSNAFSVLSYRSGGIIHGLSGLSAICFTAAFVFSPKTFRHPYLLWSTLIASSAGALDLLFRPTQTTFATRLVVQDRKGKGPRKLDASYEVVGDLNGEGLSLSDEDIEEEVNGEEVRTEVLRFFTTQTMRAYLAGLGFTVSLVGLWGDGA